MARAKDTRAPAVRNVANAVRARTVAAPATRRSVARPHSVNSQPTVRQDIAAARSMPDLQTMRVGLNVEMFRWLGFAHEANERDAEIVARVIEAMVLALADGSPRDVLDELDERAKRSLRRASRVLPASLKAKQSELLDKLLAIFVQSKIHETEWEAEAAWRTWGCLIVNEAFASLASPWASPWALDTTEFHAAASQAAAAMSDRRAEGLPSDEPFPLPLGTAVDLRAAHGERAQIRRGCRCAPCEKAAPRLRAEDVEDAARELVNVALLAVRPALAQKKIWAFFEARRRKQRGKST